MKKSIFFSLIVLCCVSCGKKLETPKDPVDYVNPYMGNISHLLVPTYPTVHLPNSMLRVYPERADYTTEFLHGLPVAVTSHRGSSAFNISPFQPESVEIPNFCGMENDVDVSSIKMESWGIGASGIKSYSYDLEKITPYYYYVYLDEDQIDVNYAPSHQSGIYSFDFRKEGKNYISFNVGKGKLSYHKDGSISGYQTILFDGEPRNNIYLYIETEQKSEIQAATHTEPNPLKFVDAELIDSTAITTIKGDNQAITLDFGDAKKVNLRYGISFISEEQAKKNLQREINTYDVCEVARKGRDIWNETLGKIKVEGGSCDEKTVFYTSLYRTYERMINISEDGQYYSPFDNQIHADNGTPFFTDDWIWDTYRATHPLRVLIEEPMENAMIASYVRMAQQDTLHGWMPTFPEITGDSHRMNGNHAVAVVWDAYAKGLRGYDLAAAYKACKAAMTEKSWLPWTKIPATEYDKFFNEKGYFPALNVGEKEYIVGVHSWEKRQPVAVLMGACYDFWCLSQIAKELGNEEDYKNFLAKSYNMRNVYNATTAFFHPKDKYGKFIEPFDYRYSGGIGARDFYDENNAYIFRWDLPHNPAFLAELMGGADKMAANLDQTFSEPLGKSKFDFYAQLPDHTGNVGQFSMANEPSFHIPYLYNYVGQPWKTQKLIRKLLKEWYRNDLMGVPGDEDGGGMSAFVVFSSMGFYPVTPGLPSYNIGSPVFQNVKMALSNGKTFEIVAENYAPNNKYIQSATLNGKEWNKPWFSHSDIINGGKLVLVMGDKANTAWGSDLADVPPSGEK
ncbi:MAG: glycoside hydrolase family 92 protein [Prevotellaceae bacterium]|jgi:predicted alpha-1,2-mannosidase|nr:glycoside hydrolase family 92 protein [Prevotellaceae bacterium]